MIWLPPGHRHAKQMWPAGTGPLWRSKHEAPRRRSNIDLRDDLLPAAAIERIVPTAWVPAIEAGVGRGLSPMTKPPVKRYTVDGKLMTPEDLRRLHDYLVDIEVRSSRTKCASWSRANGPSSSISCRRDDDAPGT